MIPDCIRIRDAPPISKRWMIREVGGGGRDFGWVRIKFTWYPHKALYSYDSPDWQLICNQFPIAPSPSPLGRNQHVGSLTSILYDILPHSAPLFLPAHSHGTILQGKSCPIYVILWTNSLRPTWKETSKWLELLALEWKCKQAEVICWW